MERTYAEDQTFEQKDFAADGLPVTDYENCNFINCNFSNADLSKINFTECAFTGCDLSLARLAKTAFKDVKFSNCKLLGLHFHDCSEMLFTVDFNNCILNLSSFYKRKLKKLLRKRRISGAFFSRIVNTAVYQQLVHYKLHGCRVRSGFGIYVDIHRCSLFIIILNKFRQGFD